MSNETQSSTGSQIGSFLLFPAITSGAEVISIAKRNGGLGKSSKVAKEMETFRKFVSNAKNPSDVKDVFSKGLSLSENYEAYKSAAKASIKAQKILDKGTIPLKDKLLNPLRRLLKIEEVTQSTIKLQNEKVISNFQTLKNNLENGENVAQKLAQKNIIDKEVAKSVKNAVENSALNSKEELEGLAKKVEGEVRPGITQKVAQDFAKTNATTLSKVGSMFKKEATNPFVLFFTALEAVPEFKNKVMPAFKEKGFKAGMKQTALSVFKIGVNFASFVSGSVLGKVAGSALGALIFPHAAAAASILGQVGSIAAISLTNALSGKIIKKAEDKAAKKEAQKQNINIEA